jgi:hypothetical protein
MALDPRITGFDADSVRDGLRLAMQVGLPPVTADQPAFHMPREFEPEPEPGSVDQEGVPFDPTYRPTKTPRRIVRNIACGLEYQDAAGKLVNLGTIVPAKVVITLLDTEYAKVKGFEFVTIGGIRYFYHHTETPSGLLSVGIWRVHCNSEDEG